MSEMTRKDIDEHIKKYLLEIDARAINEKGVIAPFEVEMGYFFNSCYVKETIFGGVKASGEGCSNGGTLIWELRKVAKCKLIPHYTHIDRPTKSEKESIKLWGYRGKVTIQITPFSNYAMKRYIACAKDDQFESRLMNHGNEIAILIKKVRNRFMGYSNVEIGISPQGLILCEGDCNPLLCSFSELGLMNIIPINQRYILATFICKELNLGGDGKYSLKVVADTYSFGDTLVPLISFEKAKVENQLNPW